MSYPSTHITISVSPTTNLSSTFGVSNIKKTRNCHLQSLHPSSPISNNDYNKSSTLNTIFHDGFFRYNNEPTLLADRQAAFERANAMEKKREKVYNEKILGNASHHLRPNPNFLHNNISDKPQNPFNSNSKHFQAARAYLPSEEKKTKQGRYRFFTDLESSAFRQGVLETEGIHATKKTTVIGNKACVNSIHQMDSTGVKDNFTHYQNYTKESNTPLQRRGEYTISQIHFG